MRTSIRNRTHIRRVLLVILFVLVACFSASAYTIVLRDGRRVEIPNSFVVGTSTLTYEAGPGIQITLQLATVDIVATERVNKESSGSLMRRAARNRVDASLKKAASAGSTITNEDLERFRQARIAGERDYEKRRKELGLPSLEESRRAALEVGERAQAQLLTIQSQEQQGEGYWRNRASDLRAELAATNASIGMIQTRLNELPLNYAFGSFAGISPGFRSFSRVSPFLSIDQLSRGAGFPKATLGNPNQFGRPQFGGRIGFGNGGFRGQVHFNPFRGPGFGRRGFPNSVPFGTVVALPFDSYDSSFERTRLLTQLNELLVYRAGLQARWRDLEDEARRNGAYPGWLR